MTNIDIINDAFEKGIDSSNKIDVSRAVKETLSSLDNGSIRVAEINNNIWSVNEWAKKAILLSFKLNQNKQINTGYTKFYDKVESKFQNISEEYLKKNNIRIVPQAIARYGSYIDKNVVLMPSFVNIGAYVGEGTMVDTWATVGSCAQIGKNVHLSGGVGIGGVLEPIQASPVIIENNVFIGSRSIVVEGVKIEEEAVLGANVVLTASTRIIDVSKKDPVEYKGLIPAKSVVIPGTYNKNFPSGSYGVPCALIIGKRKDSTNKKTSLNEALREYNVCV